MNTGTIDLTIRIRRGIYLIGEHRLFCGLAVYVGTLEKENSGGWREGRIDNDEDNNDDDDDNALHSVRP